jgi:hypothetical protein
MTLLALLRKSCREHHHVRLTLLNVDIDKFFQPLNCWRRRLLLGLLAFHQHGPEIHTALDGDKEFEIKLLLAVLILQDALVLGLFFLTTLVDAKNNNVTFACTASGPHSEAWLHSQVFEAFEEGHLRWRISLYLKRDEDIFSWNNLLFLSGASDTELQPN